MPYTLAMFLLWAVLIALVAGIIGWLLRSLRARRQIAAARNAAGHVDSERLRELAAELELVSADRDRLRMEVADVRGSSAGALGFARRADPEIIVPDDDPGREAVDAPPVGHDDTTTDRDVASLDLAAAAEALGRPMVLDDLTVVEGIGPNVAELCAGIGVTTWRQLAETDTSTLRSMLDDAGSRFARHDPASWPRQAELLADGEWDEFVAMNEGHDDGP